MGDLTQVVENTIAADSGVYPLSARLYPNIQSYPGQLLYVPPRLSARQETNMSRADAVRATRHVERTNEHIRGGIDRNVEMVVGARLIVHPTPDWDLLGIKDWKTKKPFAQACQRAFNSWAYDNRNLCDAEGDLNFGGLMNLAYRNVRAPDGETHGIIHFDEARRTEYNTAWGTFIQVVDPDRVDTPPEHAGDPNVVMGRKLDRHGRRLGTYFKKKHPSEGWDGTSVDFEFVPRETWWGRPMSWHWFFKTRGGQPRGITALVTVLKPAIKIDSLDDSHIGAAALAAVMASYIKTTATPETVAEMLAPMGTGRSVTDMKLDHYEKSKIQIGGQRLPVLAPNDELKMESVQRSLADPTAFRNGFLRQFALALGVSFEQISNNFSDANYSAARAALLEVWRGVISARTLFTSHVASLVYSAVIEEAIEIGAVQLPPGAPPFQENRAAYTACTWTGPGMGWIDPLKEANAMLVRLQAKTSTRQKEAAANGDDYLEIFDQIEQEEIEAEERNFSLEVNQSAAALPPDGGPEEATPKKKNKSGKVQGDGDGDGVANEAEEA